MSISGTIVPMVSPTTGRTGDIDERTLHEYTKWLVSEGVHGLFPCGSIGEFSSLTTEQRQRIIRTTVEAAAGEIPVYAGCGDTSVTAVREHVASAADAGADAAVVVTPYYLSTTQTGLVDFYRAVADDAQIPLVLYNIPNLTGKHLGVDTVATLADHDSIIAIKDTSGDLGYTRDLVVETPDEFAVLQGMTRLAVASLDVGADGIVAGPANVYPSILSALYDVHVAGDHDAATKIMNRVVHPMLSVSSDLPTAATLKFLLSISDRDVGEPLAPLPQLSTTQKRRLQDFSGSLVFDEDAVFSG